MTKQEVGSLAYKLAGLYTLIQSALSLYVAMYFVREVQHGSVPSSLDWRILVGVGAAPTFILAALGIALIRGSERWAQRTFAEPGQVATTVMTATDLKAALLTVIGVAMIAWAVPNFVGFAPYLATSNLSEATVLSLVYQNKFQLSRDCAAVLVGVALIISRRGALEGWPKVRRAWLIVRGRQEIEDDTENGGGSVGRRPE